MLLCCVYEHFRAESAHARESACCAQVQGEHTLRRCGDELLLLLLLPLIREVGTRVIHLCKLVHTHEHDDDNEQQHSQAHTDIDMMRMCALDTVCLCKLATLLLRRKVDKCICGVRVCCCVVHIVCRSRTHMITNHLVGTETRKQAQEAAQVRVDYTRHAGLRRTQAEYVTMSNCSAPSPRSFVFVFVRWLNVLFSCNLLLLNVTAVCCS